MRIRRLAVAATALSLLAVGCGDVPHDDDGLRPPQPQPRTGGTLRLKGAGDVDHLDTASAYYTASYTILRALSRQLVSYPTSTDLVQRDVPVADLAEPGEFMSPDGLRYTFTIKQGAKFNHRAGSRQIVANDVVVGLKRICDPNNPSGGLVYFTDTVKGFSEFCDGFGKAVRASDPDGKRIAAVKAYVESNHISGVTTDGGRTIRFELKRPAGDFLNILAMPFASPVAPEVALKYVADSPDFRRNFVSSGPYQLASYTADKSIKLVRNPAWDKATDDLRNAYVDQIEVTQGSDEEPVQQELEAGTVDLSWDTGVPTPRIAQLKNDPIQGLGGSDQRLYAEPDGCTAYLVMRTDRKPFDDVRVRQAVNWAINRAAIVQVAGGRDVQTPAYNVLTPPILGYRQLDLYRTEGDRGDPEQAKALLREAGYPNGIDVTFLHRNSGKHPAYAAAHQAALAKAGIRLKLKPVAPAAFYSEYLQKVKNGEWDLAQPGWCPDWAGNAARTFFSALFDGRNILDGSTNYSRWRDGFTDETIAETLAATDRATIERKWAELDSYLMDKAVWAPVMTGKVHNYRGNRVKNWVYFPFSHGADVTNVWLDPPTP